MAKRKNKTGRPTKLTPKVQAAIVRELRKGAYIETACALALVDRSQYFRWMQQGEQEERGIYRDFCDAVKKAQAQAEQTLLNRIQVASKQPKHWTAAAWQLERKFPRRYGQRVHVSVQEELNDALSKLERKLTPEELERVLEALASDDGEGAAGGAPAQEGGGGGSGAAAPGGDPGSAPA